MHLPFKKIFPFSHIRLRQVMNDLKLRDIDAAKDLNISKKKYRSILTGRTKLNKELLARIINKWPIKFSEFINPIIDKKDFKIMKINIRVVKKMLGNGVQS